MGNDNGNDCVDNGSDARDDGSDGGTPRDNGDGSDNDGDRSRGGTVGAQRCCAPTCCAPTTFPPGAAPTSAGRAIRGATPNQRRSRFVGCHHPVIQIGRYPAINIMRNTPGAPVWQRNYYEHIIRTDRALNATRRYIADNPRRWHLDSKNIHRIGDDPLAREIWDMLRQHDDQHGSGHAP
ncbi:MAG: hypothetical protein J7463_13405 [Roseiflexus sp.]|nr:hypothetical protein [Roseiflexus sp.]MBO9334957.1 hypothetical protein [Roseiflexus sp.]MBO9342323.1 hypothetical protein [Roseiflexus sp.]MBO9366158.1 hypothetical protein [Roseiflexus sp.]MBO9383445.1 hypothetical protein [Roseiflexus sp.]